MSEVSADQDKDKDKVSDIDGLKTEMANHLESMSSKLTATNDQFKQVLDVLIQSQAQKEVETEKNVGDLTPEELEDRILKKADKLATDRYAMTQEKQAKIQSVLVELNADYPEIGKQGHELNKKMVEFHAKLPEHMRDTPEGYRMAALQAASDTGTLPVSKRRKASDDDFTFTPGMGSPFGKPNESKTKKLARESLMLAQLMGVDIEDKKVIERMETYNARNFSRYR